MNVLRFSWVLGAMISIGGVAVDGAEPARTGQHSGQFEIQQSVGYLLFLPEAYAQKEKWPMIVFLHGAGERGDDLQLVKRHGPPKIVESDPDFSFIVLSPQCPTGRWWSTDTVIELMDHIVATEKVDPDRIYLTGLSMGGFGTWDIASRYPYRFAAIAPICGGGNPRFVRRMKNLPVWVFHGAKDPVVPIASSQAMVDALKAIDGNVKFTIYPEARHDAWTETYANPELYKWFLAHKRQGPPPRRRR